MADDDWKSSEDIDDSSPISVPSHDPLPPPPEVEYTRPILNKGISSRNSPKSVAGPGSSGSQTGFSDASSGATGWGRGISVSVTFAVTIIGGFLAGQWMDHRLFHNGSQVWCTFVMTILGFGLAFAKVLRLTSGWDKGDKK